MKMLRVLAILFAGLAGQPVVAAEPVLVVTAGGAAKQFTSDELLARRDAATLTLSHDPAYDRAMTYRAVPLRALLSALPPDAADTTEARATDGFVSQLPRALVEGAAAPWVAIEDPAHPWPHLPGKTDSAGPFYLIWQDPQGARVPPSSGRMRWPR